MGGTIDRRFRVLVASFSATLYLALLIAALGLIGLITNSEVIAGPSRGPLLGPAMVAAAVSAMLVGCVRASRTARAETRRISVTRAIVVGLVAYLSYVLVGGVAVAIGAGSAVAGVVFVSEIVVTPFSVSVGILATVATIMFEVAIDYRMRHDDRPRWPWERHI